MEDISTCALQVDHTTEQERRATVKRTPDDLKEVQANIYEVRRTLRNKNQTADSKKLDQPRT